MNTKIAIGCLIALFVSPCFGETLLTLDSLQLSDGRKFQKVTITKIENDKIDFGHDGGLARVTYKEFPEHVLKRLGITPLDAEEYRNYQSNQAMLKAQRIEELKAEEENRRKLKAQKLVEEQRERAALEESRRIAAQEAAENAAKRRQELVIAKAREEAEAKIREEEMLRINPNYKRIQELEQYRNRIAQEINKNALAGNPDAEYAARCKRELRLVDAEILFLTPGRTDEQNKQLALQMELEDQREQAQAAQRAQLAAQLAAQRREMDDQLAEQRKAQAEMIRRAQAEADAEARQMEWRMKQEMQQQIEEAKRKMEWERQTREMHESNRYRGPSSF